MDLQPIIEFKDFSFQYYSQVDPTLYNINLSILPGEKILIVGPSGSGKSTLGNCINGLIPFAYDGEITGDLLINGESTQDKNIFELSKSVGTVLQDSDAQFVSLTAGEDIAFSLENDNVPNAEMHEQVKKVSQMVDMQNWLTSSPFELSGGQKQRTTLAGVLVNDVDILLFDEPLANLDPATGKTAIEIIEEICSSVNKTIIIIEHRLEDVLHRYVDRIIVINEGRIIANTNAHALVSSDILTKTGIREPLYVTALKYAGVPITESIQPGYITSVKAHQCKDALTAWQASIQPPQVQEEKPTVLKVENLNFSYDGIRNVLEEINFELKEGEMVSLIGKNGSGKSTLSKLICGFEKQDQGIISYRGNDTRDKSIKERAEIIGLVLQNPNQMISKNLIFDEVALGLRFRKIPEEEIVPRVEKVLDVCGLAPFIEWPISALSYGQRKRVTIASILVMGSEILILDEPTAGQDYRHYTEIMEFLVEINKMGVTIILITHDMHLMLEYTPRALVLAEGHLIADAPASSVLTDLQIIQKANLKETSLYHLAQMAEIPDSTAFVQGFINYERKLKNR
ncbi:MAG TPA: ABC transporter ATP-binding protein [Brevefilum fermentans]|jgi:energy-coupling factor transport system ATP-binding protein|uniref:Putative enzyme n=1 Tax=Candidatus Brevifilum fermentans TaxID=1986204 RepID=A0A1Y6K5J6_9CHLR|nr:ABC transporter ATP-binding protein [Brevefilum fermentans]MDI9566866.1 ABC transporter ATP-binding protein [Chloroflexota bacterium]OQB82897.1 MAG: putative HMP/thiamine import ATP-binding protein YkoD [Chloroflexi bacterium ADurb.Bin120]SMX54904.1 putative enzyme [Brevefilum fermentans]HOM67387.1 ABC transporter ATP-binding protein [Brevefilum fermentans]HPX94932.1 ABC transporter ATP-binding protein [Brevefilum fermentans]